MPWSGFMHTKGIRCWRTFTMRINPAIIIGSSYLFIISLTISLFFLYSYQLISFVILYLLSISHDLSSRIDNSPIIKGKFADWLYWLIIWHFDLFDLSALLLYILVIYNLTECKPAEWESAKCFIVDPVIKLSFSLKPCFIGVLKRSQERNLPQ